MVESELRTDQQYEPVQVNPDECRDRDSEARVNLLRARREKYKGRENCAHRHPHDAADQAADQCRLEVDFRVRHEHIHERKHTGDQQVGHELSANHEYRSKGLVIEQILNDGVALDRRDHADRRYHDHRTDEQNDEIFRKSPGEIARLRYVPHVVEAFFDLLHHADSGVEKKRHSEPSEHGSLDVIHQCQNLSSDTLTLFAQWCEQIVEIRLELIEHTEPFQDCKTDRK